MQTVQFSCPHCNNLMAVGPELLGQLVRCPSCSQVLQAPAASPEPVPVPAAEPPPDNVPEFRVPTEGVESIFSDHDEDLFGSSRKNRPELELVIPMHLAETAPPATPVGTGFANYPPPGDLPHPAPSNPDPSAVPPIESPPPDAGAPVVPTMTLEIAPDPTAAPPEPTADAGTTPPEAIEPAADAAWAAEPVANAGWVAPSNATGAARQPVSGGRGNLLLTFLIPFAITGWILAVYFYVSHQRAKQVHPLEMIPDLLYYYDRPKNDTVSRSVKMPPADQKLPDNLKVDLGQSLTIGSLELTPLRIEQRPLVAYTIRRGEDEPRETRFERESLVLHLRLKNVSDNLPFYPTDPVFDRRFKPEAEEGRPLLHVKPYTLLEIGKLKVYGGVIEYGSFSETKLNRRIYLQGQENDDKPLAPGASRDTIIATHPADRAVEAMQGYKGKDPLVWRVLVRRGLVPFQKREISVCAVVGVRFMPADVRK
jgi:hypothetical protein